MASQPSEADRNFREFFDRHGKEGFLQLFLTNYLFELVQYFLHSELKGKDDTSITYYINFRGRLYRPEEIDQFEADLKEECRRRAQTVVKQLKELGIAEQIARDPLMHPKVSELVVQQLENILKEVVEGQE